MHKHLINASISEESDNSGISTSSKRSCSSKRFIDGLNNSRAALKKVSQFKLQLKSEISSSSLSLWDTANPSQPQICYENSKIPSKKTEVETRFESVGEEGTAQVVHSPVVRRGKSADYGYCSPINFSLIPETLEKNKKRIECHNKTMSRVINYQSKFDELEELKTSREKIIKLMDEKNQVEFELLKVSMLMRDTELNCKAKDAEIENLKKSLQNFDQNSAKVNLELKLAKESFNGYIKEINALHKEVLEVKTKLEIVEMEKLNLKQDLQNANEENCNLKEKIRKVEHLSLEKNEQKAIKNLSNIILSKERNDHRAMTIAPECKDLEAKLKTAETDCEQFKNRYYNTLETLKSTGEWILDIIDLIHYGNSKSAIEEFLRTSGGFEEQMKIISQELTNINGPLLENSPMQLKSPVLANNQEVKTLKLQLSHEKADKKELEETMRIIQENINSTDLLSYLQAQASVIEECLRDEPDQDSP
ncbi:unnamed protein product [Blepharisma stoltei]|uniref:Uncharacterized protein n=1 Tax=Blepharisma stoltei TaxID=1481888 RepID=A0AAU9IAH0_9CILI|nr:unnamed protein product [Blepharisma stoltei]